MANGSDSDQPPQLTDIERVARATRDAGRAFYPVLRDPAPWATDFDRLYGVFTQTFCVASGYLKKHLASAGLPDVEVYIELFEPLRKDAAQSSPDFRLFASSVSSISGNLHSHTISPMLSRLWTNQGSDTDKDRRDFAPLAESEIEMRDNRRYFGGVALAIRQEFTPPEPVHGHTAPDIRGAVSVLSPRPLTDEQAVNTPREIRSFAFQLSNAFQVREFARKYWEQSRALHEATIAPLHDATRWERLKDRFRIGT